MSEKKKPAKSALKEPAKSALKEPAKSALKEPAKSALKEPAKSALKEPAKSTLKELGEIREPGLRKLDSTSAFRAVNFELYAKPNWFVMGFGLLAVSGCVAVVAYMHAQQENSKDSQYIAEDLHGNQTIKTRTNKWD